VPGSVRFDQTELFCGYQRCRGSFEQSLATLLAKLRAEPGCSTAIWADNFKPRAAVLTEYGVARILGLAMKAVHGAANLSPSELTASRTGISSRIELNATVSSCRMKS
jgi:hypothetical protein